MEDKEIHSHDTINLMDVKYNNDGKIIYGEGGIKEPVVCVRPGHKSGLPQIYSEENNGKIIFHNYGHSGIGWSLLFGSVNQSIENFLKNSISNDRNEQILIIGLGCIGLVTAISLYSHGYTNIKLIGENFTDTASFWAGGLFEFSLSNILKEENFNYLNGLFEQTFYEYQRIVNGLHPLIKKGVKEVDYYTDFYQENAGLDYLSRKGLIPPVKEVHLRLGKQSKSSPRKLYHFKTFNINTVLFMQNLRTLIESSNIEIETKKLNSFDEVNQRIVFNCSGIGSKYLNKDNDCYPICGHGVVLSDKTNGDLGFILRLSTVTELGNDENNGALYFMPKETGFIGGTYMKDYDGNNEKLNHELITKLIERSKFVFNGIINPNMTILKPKF